LISRLARLAVAGVALAMRSDPITQMSAPQPESRMTIDQLVAQSRKRLCRLAAADAYAAMRGGAVLVDIRSDSQRSRDGIVPGAVFVARNVLEWRCAPSSRWRDPRLSDPDTMLILMCDEGYQSSLAAATLHELGLPLATDVAGGFQAWRAQALPVQAPAALV
jgi:rhodanese-related sulfurtransferase